MDEPAEELGERPKCKAARQQQTRAELVHHGGCGQLRERIGPEKGGDQIAHFRNGKTEFFPDQRIGDGQCRTVDVIDDAGNHQQGQGDTLYRFEARRRQFHP